MYVTAKIKQMQKVENIHETPHDGKPLLSAVVYQSDGRTFNYLSKLKPPIRKHIFIHTKDDEVISCTARNTNCLEFHFRDFKGYAEEHEVVGWSFPQ